MSDLTVVVGDDAPSLFGSLTDSSGNPFDLTDASAVRFQLRELIDRRLKVDAVAVIVTAATGSVRYDWVAGDLDMAGDYEGRWLIEWNDGSLEHTDPSNSITVATA